MFPTGLLPKLATHAGDFALVRSMQSHALVHSLSQTWVQIGRNPAAALGNIAPNIGSVVAIEKDKERKPSQIFPTFLALNSGGGVGPGYFPANFGPFKVQPATGGIANTTNSTGQTRFTNRLKLMHSLDDNLRTTGVDGSQMVDYDEFYSAANELMYNPIVNQILRVQHGGQPALRQRDGGHHAGQFLPGGGPGVEGAAGHALHPDHEQRWLGHAPEHLRGGQFAGEGGDSGQRRFGAAQRSEVLRPAGSRRWW